MEPPDDTEYCMSSDRFADQRIEIIPGKKVNSEWLVLNDLYIQHKNRDLEMQTQKRNGMSIQNGNCRHNEKI